MKNLLRTLIVILCISTGLQAGKVFDFKLKDLNYKRISYTQLKGENLTILDFWATWCKPCIRAIPKLVQTYDKYKERGLQVLGINVDSPRNVAKVKPVSRSLGITYPVLLDMNNEVMTNLHVTVVPTLFIVDKNDEIIFIHRGYKPGDERILEQELDKILEKDERNKK
jgi:thiol-disulfide isomerase/thioredoxin